MRIVFMGTPDFAAVSLQRLLDAHFDVVGVFTQPDKPQKPRHEAPAEPGQGDCTGKRPAGLSAGKDA